MLVPPVPDGSRRRGRCGSGRDGSPHQGSFLRYAESEASQAPAVRHPPLRRFRRPCGLRFDAYRYQTGYHAEGPCPYTGCKRKRLPPLFGSHNGEPSGKAASGAPFLRRKGLQGCFPWRLRPSRRRGGGRSFRSAPEGQGGVRYRTGAVRRPADTGLWIHCHRNRAGAAQPPVGISQPHQSQIPDIFLRIDGRGL